MDEKYGKNPEQEKDTPKKSYERPELVRYGRIRNLTQGSAGSISDGLGGGLHNP